MQVIVPVRFIFYVDGKLAVNQTELAEDFVKRRLVYELGEHSITYTEQESEDGKKWNIAKHTDFIKRVRHQ